MSDEVKFRDVEITGDRTYPVWLTYSGKFTAQRGDMLIMDTTFDGLVGQLNKYASKTAIRISMHYTDHNDMGEREVRGIHRGTGQYLVRTKGGDTEQLRSLPYDALRVLTPEEREEWTKLRTAYREAGAALDAWERGRRFKNLRELVRELVDFAIETASAAADKK